jgi:hypothetical protein
MPQDPIATDAAAAPLDAFGTEALIAQARSMITAAPAVPATRPEMQLGLPSTYWQTAGAATGGDASGDDSPAPISSLADYQAFMDKLRTGGDVWAGKQADQGNGFGQGTQLAEIYAPDPKQRGRIADWINSTAAGQFRFDDQGRLRRTQPDSFNTMGRSTTYSDELDQAIASPNRLSVQQTQYYNDGTTGGPKNMDNLYPGGGVTQAYPGYSALSLLSGNSHTILDKDGNSLHQTPDQILMHEMGTHGIPAILATPEQRPGNAIVLENQMRGEMGLRERQDEPTHLYWKPTKANP